jgi:hypothetical protein
MIHQSTKVADDEKGYDRADDLSHNKGENTSRRDAGEGIAQCRAQSVGRKSVAVVV